MVRQKECGKLCIVRECQSFGSFVGEENPLGILKQQSFVNEFETLVLASGSNKMPQAH